MKGQQVNREGEQILVIDINLTRGLAIAVAAALVLAAVLGILAWGQQEAAAALQAPASSLGMRQYYVTKGMYDGADADGTDGNGAGVCAPGYHFASLWEIMDPSNLQYNSDLGWTCDDSGQGPPSCLFDWMWVRTGYSGGGDNSPGTANCYNWNSNASDVYGTMVRLVEDWNAATSFPAWYTGYSGCSYDHLVWCVED